MSTGMNLYLKTLAGLEALAVDELTAAGATATAGAAAGAARTGRGLWIDDVQAVRLRLCGVGTGRRTRAPRR